MNICESLKNKDSDFWDKTECVNLLKYCEEVKFLLKELYSTVNGECPQLLDEDRGGAAWLDMRITEALKD